MDKWSDGFTYSCLLCTEEEGNNSAERRRAIAFADAPALDNTRNLTLVLEPIYTELALLKYNSSILKLGSHCAVISCDYDRKVCLDAWHRRQQGVETSVIPHTMLQTEIYLRKTSWNLANHSVDKLFTLNTNEENHLMLNSNVCPPFFVSTNDSKSVYNVDIWMRNVN